MRVFECRGDSCAVRAGNHYGKVQGGIREMGYECDKCKILIVEDELMVRKALRYII